MTSAATDFSVEPAQGALHERLIEGEGGRLRVAHARPRGRARGTVLALPGRGELVEKYRPLAHEITGWGYGFFMLDWRGQGASARLLPDPRKGHIVDFRHYLEDLATALRYLAELGLVKPDPAIYRHMLDATGRAPGECFFIDDNAGNVEAARALGIVAHRFTDPASLRDDLRRHRLLG